MDLSKLSTARKLELMKSFVRLDRPKTALKLKTTYHPSARRKQKFNLINPNASIMHQDQFSGEAHISIFNQPQKQQHGQVNTSSQVSFTDYPSTSHLHPNRVLNPAKLRLRASQPFSVPNNERSLDNEDIQVVRSTRLNQPNTAGNSSTRLLNRYGSQPRVDQESCVSIDNNEFASQKVSQFMHSVSKASTIH